MKKLILAASLLIVVYIAIYAFGGSIASHNRILSRFWGTVFYTFRISSTCPPRVLHETGTLDEDNNGWGLRYLKPREDASHTVVGGILFRVPPTLLLKVKALKGKLVEVVIDTESDPVEFNKQSFVLASISPVVETTVVQGSPLPQKTEFKPDPVGDFMTNHEKQIRGEWVSPSAIKTVPFKR